MTTTFLSPNRSCILLSLAGGLALAAILTALSAGGGFWRGWLAGSLLAVPSLFLLLGGWRWAGGGRHLAWVIALAFLLRLGFGVFSMLALPDLGYEEPSQQAGYTFYDAFRRDSDAWKLVQTGEPLGTAFTTELMTDQYGGLLSLSAAIYRYLSPDAHRPFLIILLAAFVFTLGIPFLWRGLRQEWDERIAALACWILVFYPDSLLVGSSLMREPFIIGLGCIAFWAVLTWKKGNRLAAAAFFASLAGMALVSSRAAVAIGGMLCVWFWLQNQHQIRSPKWRRTAWVLVGLAALAFAAMSWDWFRVAAQWDFTLTERSSGWVQKAIDELGRQWRIPFITLYGLAQPVLPAAIAAPAIPFWKTVNILRAAGWYLLAPLMVYAIFTIRAAQPLKRRWLLAWLAAFAFAWVVISAARGGGDQWDNPRYRLIFLPWMALLAAWALEWARQRGDHWLWRLLLVEAIFLAFFTNWYFSRYFLLWRRLPFWQNVAWIVGLSALVLVGGWLWDRWRGRRKGRS